MSDETAACQRNPSRSLLGAASLLDKIKRASAQAQRAGLLETVETLMDCAEYVGRIKRVRRLMVVRGLVTRKHSFGEATFVSIRCWTSEPKNGVGIASFRLSGVIGAGFFFEDREFADLLQLNDYIAVDGEIRHIKRDFGVHGIVYVPYCRVRHYELICRKAPLNRPPAREHTHESIKG